ncbi:MAG: UDP-N-acetylmuramate dehydrogenase [Oscillospiraceae bacterium]|nr:UDP-N-acetylmuramate dehydrogenase [Oscillospiraceae bacterium]
MNKELQQICNAYQMQLQENISLASHTTFHIGGNADFWIEINSTQGLGKLLQFCDEKKINYFVMGRGSNILASDNGYQGVILHLGNCFSEIKMQEMHDKIILTCQAGAMLSNIAKFAMEHSLTGMEALSGIPGTVGGALYMNAGAYGSEMKDIVIACSYINKFGKEYNLTSEDLNLSYRHSFFTEHAGAVITSVTICLKKGNPEEIAEKYADFSQRRKTKQPLNYPSAGSTFKRPEGSYASKLIDECGLKGYQIGGAQVSEKHAGFVINKANATCQDVLNLCQHVHDVVLEKTGYLLELEPVFLESQGGELSCS